MKTYCKSCGQANEYSLKEPIFCSFCGISFANIVIQPLAKTQVISQPQTTEIDFIQAKTERIQRLKNKGATRAETPKTREDDDDTEEDEDYSEDGAPESNVNKLLSTITEEDFSSMIQIDRPNRTTMGVLGRERPDENIKRPSPTTAPPTAEPAKKRGRPAKSKTPVSAVSVEGQQKAIQEFMASD